MARSGSDRPSGGESAPAARLANLAAQVRRGAGDATRLIEAARAAAASGLFASGDPELAELRASLTATIADLATAGPDQPVRDGAVLALAALDTMRAAAVCHQLFARSPGSPDRPASRLLERLTGRADPPPADLVESLTSVDGFRAALTSRALAERGMESLPALRSALRALPVPAVPDSPTWWVDETAKYRIMRALEWLGPLAEPVVPVLIALLEDEEGYRDTRHQAAVTLHAVGRPAVTTLVSRLRRRLTEHPDGCGDDDQVDGTIYVLVHALSGMPPAAFLNVPGLDEALEQLRHESLSGPTELIRDKLPRTGAKSGSADGPGTEESDQGRHGTRR